MRKRILMTMVGAIVLTFLGCSGDNDNVATVDEEQEAMEARIRDELKTEGIMKELCQIDTLDNGKLSYTPRIGKALESATPTVYYTIGYDLEFARQTFNGIIAALNEDKEKNLDVDDVRQGNIHLTFSQSTASGEIARIAVDCPDLKDVLTEIVFVTKDRWPENVGHSPFKMLDIYKYKNNYYVCVRTSESASGIMLSLDINISEEDKDKFEKYDYWQGKFWLLKNPAKAEAYTHLIYIMKNFPRDYELMLARMDAAGGPKIWSQLFNTKAYIIFDSNYSYTHGLWCFYNCYYIDLNIIMIHKFAEGKWEMTFHCSHYEHKQAPNRSISSKQFNFDSNFTKSSEWECIYKGT